MISSDNFLAAHMWQWVKRLFSSAQSWLFKLLDRFNNSSVPQETKQPTSNFVEVGGNTNHLINNALVDHGLNQLEQDALNNIESAKILFKRNDLNKVATETLCKIIYKHRASMLDEIKKSLIANNLSFFILANCSVNNAVLLLKCRILL